MYWRKRTGCVGGNGLDVLVAMDWMHDGDGLDARRRLFLDPLPSILATRGNKTKIKLPFYFF